MNKFGITKIIEINDLDVKLAYKYDGCESCAFHDTEPGICEECDDESEYEQAEYEDRMEMAA